MKAKTFFKTFRWGTICPNVISLLAAVLAVCVPFGNAYDLEIALGVLFALTGVLSCAAFLLDRYLNIIFLLAGAAQLAVAIWLFCSADVALNLLSIALGVVVILYAASEIFEAATAKETVLRRRIVCIVTAAIFIALMIVTFVNPFKGFSDTCKYTASIFLVGIFFVTLRDIVTNRFFEPEKEERPRPSQRSK